MPVINESSLTSGNLRGEDHGATISVILDHSEPGRGSSRLRTNIGICRVVWAWIRRWKVPPR
jgi:hypothetical protein